MTPRRAALVLLAGILALSGCAALPESARSRAQAQAVERSARSYLDALPAPEGRHAVLQVERSRPYTGLVLLSTPRGRSLPSRLQDADGVSVPLERALESAEVAQRIGAASGLEVRLIGPPRMGANGKERPFSGRFVGDRALGARPAPLEHNIVQGLF